MPLAVASSACLQCSFGLAPGTLNVLPTHRAVSSGLPLATIMDNIPMLNIATFGMCQSLANPSVAAATAAALGALTPMPCVPVTAAPWIPGSAPKGLLGNTPLLDANAMLMCAWGGIIKISMPGQVKLLLP